ncbi:MAG TPA: galactokinase, partial [Pontiella sp.]|nr:galactokinase [Pontiella sp.]
IAMYDKTAVEKAVSIHTATYGTAPTTVSYAPGRIEILGNHTDYNEGTVLSAAISMGNCFCLSPSGKPGVRLTAGNVGGTVEFDPAGSTPLDKQFQWANYVKGTLYYLRSKGAVVENVDCTFFGSIPLGAGLSSSAALEIATAYAALDHAGVTLDKVVIAKAAQKAEHDFAGCNCGLLDQFSSIYGMHHGLIHTDFRSLKATRIKLPDDIVCLMINPHIKHALADSPYNARRVSCEKAVRELGDLLDHPVTALRDVSWEQLEANKDSIDPEAALRARHVVGEITRVEEAIKHLRDGRLESFGQLLYDSHESSRTAFENSCDEIDIVVQAAREAGALGARISGGGWGGSAVALVHACDADAICSKIVTICQAKGLHPTAETIIPSAGATLVKQITGEY